MLVICILNKSVHRLSFCTVAHKQLLQRCVKCFQLIPGPTGLPDLKLSQVLCEWPLHTTVLPHFGWSNCCNISPELVQGRDKGLAQPLSPRKGRAPAPKDCCLGWWDV